MKRDNDLMRYGFFTLLCIIAIAAYLWAKWAGYPI